MFESKLLSWASKNCTIYEPKQTVFCVHDDRMPHSARCSVFVVTGCHILWGVQCLWWQDATFCAVFSVHDDRMPHSARCSVFMMTGCHILRGVHPIQNNYNQSQFTYNKTIHLSFVWTYELILQSYFPWIKQIRLETKAKAPDQATYQHLSTEVYVYHSLRNHEALQFWRRRTGAETRLQTTQRRPCN
jgi:hypothetical protein